jgi:hypothetical protein
MKAIWLFRFISYSYSQGTRDKRYDDIRLLTFTLPVGEEEAKTTLANSLLSESIEYDWKSITSLNINITNS